MTIPSEPSAADFAALISYCKNPDDDPAAVVAVVQETDWSLDRAHTYVMDNRTWMLKVAGNLRAALPATDGNLQQAALLAAARGKRTAVLAQRVADLSRELASLMPTEKTVREVFSE